MESNFRNSMVLDLFSEECEVIGPENVDSILSGGFKPVKAEFGEDMPIAEVVGIVVAAVGFIDASISLFDRFTKMEEQNCNVESFIAFARSELKIPEEINNERIEVILRCISSRKL